jgi:hypothetical protein
MRESPHCSFSANLYAGRRPQADRSEPAAPETLATTSLRRA